MPVVTEQQYSIMLEVERITRNYIFPRSECLALVKVGFEAGQIAGLNQYAITVTAQVNGGDRCLPS
jgi:hypothetical protein